MNKDKIGDWRVLHRGALGIEVTAWCGFGFGKNLFHIYARLGVFTVYASSLSLDRLLARMAAVRDAMRGGGK